MGGYSAFMVTARDVRQKCPKRALRAGVLKHEMRNPEKWGCD